METVWRSRPRSVHQAAIPPVQNLASAGTCRHCLALEGAYGRLAVTLLVERPGAGQGLAKVRYRAAWGARENKLARSPPPWQTRNGPCHSCMPSGPAARQVA